MNARPAAPALSDGSRTRPGRARKKCLILTADTCLADQIAMQLENHVWSLHIVHDDKSTYTRIAKDGMHIVIADIDTVDLGGLAVLAYCHQQYPSIQTYAITPVDDDHRKGLARDLGGCQGFFYLMNDGLRIDASRGMAAVLSAGRPDWEARHGGIRTGAGHETSQVQG